jgi:hypothetical protein
MSFAAGEAIDYRTKDWMVELMRQSLKQNRGDAAAPVPPRISRRSTNPIILRIEIQNPIPATS